MQMRGRARTKQMPDMFLIDYICPETDGNDHTAALRVEPEESTRGPL